MCVCYLCIFKKKEVRTQKSPPSAPSPRHPASGRAVCIQMPEKTVEEFSW